METRTRVAFGALLAVNCGACVAYYLLLHSHAFELEALVAQLVIMPIHSLLITLVIPRGTDKAYEQARLVGGSAVVGGTVAMFVSLGMLMSYVGAG